MKFNAKKTLQLHDLKYSKQREQIMESLSTIHQPVSVEELYDMLKSSGKSMNLSTVYRTVETLSGAGLVEKVYSSITNNNLIQLAQNHHQHYLMCINCHKMIPIDYCPMKELLDYIDENYEFEVTAHQLEISGYCKECKEKVG
jgi:Fur family ferric uptake transcriptional regulator